MCEPAAQKCLETQKERKRKKGHPSLDEKEVQKARILFRREREMENQKHRKTSGNK